MIDNATTNNAAQGPLLNLTGSDGRLPIWEVMGRSRHYIDKSNLSQHDINSPRS